MKVSDIKNILDANVLTCNNIDKCISYAFGSDLMSDVLAYINEETVLLTGLNNPQVIRTAEMVDVSVIVFVRGKQPTKEIIKLAEENDITILATEHIMFTACGLLYSNGLRGLDEQ